MSREILNPRIKRIILHIGLHKTGTSSIQLSFFRAADILKEHGVLYPTSWVSPNPWTAQHNHFLYILFKEDLTYYMRNFGFSASQIEESRRAGEPKLMEELRTTEAHTVVISSENVSLFEDKDLQNIHTFFRTHFDAQIDVFIYTRHHIEWTRSMLQQLIRQQHTYQSAWRYINDHAAVVYTGIYQRCANIFGEQNIYLRTYENLIAHPKGIIAGFCDDIGIDINTEQLQKLTVNQSMTQFAIDLCDYINTHEPLNINNSINPKRKIGDVHPLSFIRGPRFEIPSSMMAPIESFFAAYVTTLYDQFGIDYRTSHKSSNTDIPYFTLNDEFYQSLTKAYTAANNVIRDLIIRYLHHAIHNEARLRDGDKQLILQLIPNLEQIPAQST